MGSSRYIPGRGQGEVGGGGGRGRGWEGKFTGGKEEESFTETTVDNSRTK